MMEMPHLETAQPQPCSICGVPHWPNGPCGCPVSYEDVTVNQFIGMRHDAAETAEKLRVANKNIDTLTTALEELSALLETATQPE